VSSGPALWAKETTSGRGQPPGVGLSWDGLVVGKGWLRMTGLIVVVVVLALATVFGLWFRRRDGRLQDVPASDSRAANAPADRALAGEAQPSEGGNVQPADPTHHGGEVLDVTQFGSELGDRATLVQFSSAFCQPCRATKVILTDIAQTVPGVVHIEVDAENHLTSVRELGVRRTPTVLILDSAGVIRKRAVGQPRKADVVAAVAAAV